MSQLKFHNLRNDQRKFGITGLSGLIGIAIAFSTGNMILSGGIILFPILILFLLYVLEKPIILLFTTFILNYFAIGLTRYIKFEGISVIMDSLLISQLILICIHGALKQDIKWKNGINILTIYATIWMLYCIMQLANPSGMVKAWILSRGLILNALIISLTTTFLITKLKYIDKFILIYSILTLCAIIKLVLQKTMGFDATEMEWLMNSESYKTHLLATGTRYFSFFSDAGNFGSNMGCAGILFGIIAFHTTSKTKKIYYLSISLLAIYAMFLSGTRGAMIVPLGGLLLYILISKNYKAILLGGIALTLIYVFFTFTYIGQSNAQIRRMRSAFQPTEDASFNVRRDNQKKLATYLKNKPFGEGLGLSGVENQKISYRFTTSIPHDSWYVKMWVETGIIGAILYIGGLLIVIAKCAWEIMFKIKNRELKGICTGILCGIFGLLLSAYGNAFWGQYPTYIFAFMGLSMILNAKHIEWESNNNLVIK